MAIDWENRIIDEVSLITTTYNANLSRRFNNGTVILYTIAVMFHVSNVFMNDSDDKKTSNTSTQPLVMNMDLPFALDQTLVYKLVIIIQLIHLMLCAYINGLLNILLINLVSVLLSNKLLSLLLYYNCCLYIFISILLTIID